MTAYPFLAITINGKEVPLQDIVAQRAVAATEFEQETFSFVRQWQTGTGDFSLQTSGSTGTPKTVHFTRHQLQQSALATIGALDLKPLDTALVCLHTRYVAGKMMLARALTNNMRIVAVEPAANPLKTAGTAATIDFAAFVPLQVETMLREGFGAALNAVKCILIGGAPVSLALQEQIARHLTGPVYSTYGMTETISHIALRNLCGPGDAYTLLPGIAVQQDERGCLVITCPYLDGPVITNDLAELQGPDRFVWLGRADNVINTGGIKVIPEQIEAGIGRLFNRLNIDQRFFVSSLPDETLGNRLILFVEGPPLSPAHWSGLQALLKEAFPPYVIPKEIIDIKRFRNTETGKISRAGTLKYFQKRG